MKLKNPETIINENKENDAYNYSLSLVSPITHEQNLTIDKIHVDLRQNSTDKLLLSFNSNEPSLCDRSSLSPPYKNSLTNTTSNQMCKNDFNRTLTSVYFNDEQSMLNMKRSNIDQISSLRKFSQFHQPIGFSYNRTQTFTIPGTKKGMKALVTGSTKIRKIHCVTPQSISSTPDHELTIDKEAIILSRYSGGFIPDPTAPKKIESLDWPAPIAIQAVPELLKTHRNQIQSQTDSNEISTIISDDQEISYDNELRHDQQLEKDINEMSKIKDTSGMAHALLEDLRLKEKIISKQLPLDPWKASRSPSAAVEPPRRCRFDSPKFASPSRRVYTHSSSTTNQDESFFALSTSYSTTPSKRKHTNMIRFNENSSSSFKTQTLSNHLEIQRSCDLDSTTNSCYSHDPDQNKSLKTTDINEQYIQSHSAPTLMSNAKIYPYEDLKILSKKRLPSDIDRDHLERHLSDDEFHNLFQMTRSEFYRLPEWRRIDLKKRLKLF